MSQGNQFEEGMKKVMLAGVGAASLTAEKSKKLLDDLAVKGAATVEEGKALNEELKHYRESKGIDAYLDSLTPEQMEELKEKILQREASGNGLADEYESGSCTLREIIYFYIIYEYPGVKAGLSENRVGIG